MITNYVWDYLHQIHQKKELYGKQNFIARKNIHIFKHNELISNQCLAKKNGVVTPNRQNDTGTSINNKFPSKGYSLQRTKR